MHFPSRTVAVSVVAGFALLSIPAQDKPAIVFKGHSEAIYSVAFNSTGTLAVTGSFDKSLRLWEPATGKPVREYSGTAGHQSLVLSVAFNPAGDQIASGGSDNFARVWDVPLNTPVRDFVHAAGVTAVAVSPDGKWIAGAAKDGNVTVWQSADGKLMATLGGHTGGATGVVFNANGQILATSAADGSIRFWNAADGKPLGVVGAHAGTVTSVAINPANNLAYSTGEDGLLKFWQLPITPSKNLPPHADAITALVLSADGNLALTGGADKAVKLSNVGTGALTRDFAGATAAVTAVELWPNGAVVAAGTADGKVHLWNAADGKLLSTIFAHAGGVTGIAAKADGAGFVTVGADGVLRAWAYPVVAVRSMQHPDRVFGASLSADGLRLVTAGADRIVRTWTLATGLAERQFTGHTASVAAAALTPDGATLVSVSADETIRVWNAANGTQTSLFAGHVGPINALAVAGPFAVTGGEEGAVKIWALPAIAPRVFLHPDAVNGFAVSPDGNRVLTIGNDKQARVWNLAAPAAERAYSLGGQPITAVAWAADNATVALAAADKSISIRNGDTEVKKIPLPDVPYSVAFAPNGASVVVGLADTSIHVFTVADGKETKKIPGHAGAVAFLRYTPKGDLLVSAGNDKTLRLWNAADFAAKLKIDLPAVPTAAAISADGLKLAAGGDKSVFLFTLADGKPAGTITTLTDVRDISFSPDGTRIAVAGADHKVRIFGPDLKLQEVFLHDGAAVAVAFHPDGKRLISAAADKTLRVWTPALIAQAAHVGPVRQVLIAPAGDKFMSVGDDKHLRIWDAKTAKEIKAIPAGDGPMVGLSQTADGTKAATAGADKTAKVWTLADGKAVLTVALAGPAQAVALSPNGLRLAIAFAEGAVHHLRVYDAITGRELQSFAVPAEPIRTLIFLADNRTLVAAGEDKLATVHDVAVTAAFPVHAGGASNLALHPGAAQAITAGADKTVKLWDLTTGKEVKTLATLADPIAKLAASRDFAVVGIAAGKIAKVLQLADGKELAAIAHPAEVVAINFNADHTRLITGAADNLGRVWDIATGRLLQTFGHAGPVRGVALHPGLPLVVTASADKTAIVHPFVSTIVVPASPMPLRAATVTANGSHVVTIGDDKVVRAFNAASGAEERKFEGAEGPLYAVAVNKAVQVLAAAGADKTVRLYNFTDAKLIGSFASAAPVRGLAFSSTGLMLVGVADDKSVTAWNVSFQPGMPMPEEFGKVVQQFAHADVASAVAIGEKGEVFTGSLDKTVKQWKVASPIPTRNFQHPNLVDCVAWSPDGKVLVTACHSGVVQFHDIEKNVLTKEIVAHGKPGAEAPVYAVVWSPDGKQVLSASFDKSMKLWDATTYALIREFKPFAEKGFEKGHTDQVFCAAFTKDGKFIVSGSSDRRIKMWSVADGTVVREFPNPMFKGEPGQSHPGGIYSLRFTADEKSLVSVGPAPRNQGYVAVWNVADGKLVTGSEVPYGPVFGLALSPDGKSLLLGCGPKVRQVAEAEAVLVPFPVAR